MGGTGGNGSYTFMLVMGMITAALTAAYMTRCVYLTFFGEFRGHGDPHESGPRITVPLWILAVLAIFAGFLFKDLFVGHGGENYFWAESIKFLKPRRLNY